MKFIYTANADYVALGEVTRAVRSTRGYHLHMRDGEVFEVSSQGFEEALQLSIVGVSPAQPGYSVLEMLYDDGDHTVHYEPVLAWAVNEDGHTLPVCATGVRADGAHVLMPDGRVVSHDGWQSSLDDWKANHPGLAS